jgi:chemotaxis protein CheD
MAHFLYPRRRAGESTPLFAAPALVPLLRHFTNRDNYTRGDLEVHLFGGAFPEGAGDDYRKTCRQNIEVADELLTKEGVELTGRDCGGWRGRKIIFDTCTGELILAKVGTVRQVDWIMTGLAPVERG